MTLSIRKMGSWFLIDTGEGKLVECCPCCGEYFTEDAQAQSVIDAVNEGKLTVESLRVTSELWRLWRNKG